MLEQHCGSALSAAELVTYLQEKKFTYKYDLDLTFQWLFKQKEIVP